MDDSTARSDDEGAADGEFLQSPPAVLCVDDDPPQLDLVEEFLTRQLPEYAVATTTDPSVVPDRLEAGDFDCLVSDYEMPGTDGLALLTELRENGHRLPFILYTGKGSEEVASKAINTGATGYLQKGGPEQLRRLVNRVKHAVSEHRAKRSARHYETVLRALGYPTYIVDENAKFSYVNGAFVELTGYNREELVGASPSLIKSQEGIERANEALRSIVSRSGPDRETFRVEIETKSGESATCRDHMAALPFDDEFRGSVGILQNITAQEKQRDRLREQNDRLGEIVSFVSHDLRTPLAQTRASVELARNSGDTGKLDRAETGLSRVEKMIEELQTLATTGITVTDAREVAVHRMVTTAWDTLSRGADSLEFDPFTVEADPERTRSLVENLLRNAVEHTEPGVTVSVGVLAAGEDRSRPSEPDGFYIEDDGPGIPADERSRIFESGYTTATEGTGLGLSIVDRVAKIHGWTLTVAESDAGGARFELRDAPVTPVDPAQPAESRGGRTG